MPSHRPTPALPCRPQRVRAVAPPLGSTRERSIAGTLASASASASANATGGGPPPALAWLRPLARLRWPLPALLTWLLCWLLFCVLIAAGCGRPAAFTAAALAGAACAAGGARGGWRRALVAGGFPLSAVAHGGLPSLPAWGWLAAAAPLLLAYPLRAWRDAPFFPTPAAALDGLDGVIALPPQARLLDAGCGLGHGLRALHRLWPAARCAGIEWSRPLAAAAAWRCRRFAAVRRGDMWAAGAWAGFHVVYVFQRPESMARAWDKACAELSPGGWLVSLEFAVPGQAPTACLGAGDGSRRPVWLYRVPDSATALAPNSVSTTRCRRR